jgi:hypothetical protein
VVHDIRGIFDSYISNYKSIVSIYAEKEMQEWEEKFSIQSQKC